MSFATALETVKGAHATTPHGAAKSMLEHVIEYAEGRADQLNMLVSDGSAIFARLVLDDRWPMADAREVLYAVRELAVTAPEHRSRGRSSHG